MYPRNAASPERISIGAVVQISDGAVQTSGVTVKVIPFGGTEASGGGTTAYSADGIVLYTPTQAETNYTSFVVAAVKSGCIPASVTIVTTASSTAGKSVVASIDNDAITAASIASDAITDAKVASDVTIASVTGAVGSVTGNVGGNVTGSVASVVAAVTVGTINANAITASALASDAVTEIQSGLATAANLTTVAGYLDTEIAAILEDTSTTIPAQIAALNNLSSAQVVSALGTGSWATAIPWNVAWAAEIYDQVESVHNANETWASLAAIKGATDKLDSAMELDSTVYRFTVNALEQAPSGGGGGSTDWTADERTAIRTILGVPSTGTTPEVPAAGALRVIDDLIDTEIGALTTALADLPTNAELTAALGTGSWATAIPWNAAWDTEVQSECTDALNAYDAPTKAEMDSAFTEIKGATWSSSTDTLEAIRDRGDAAWVTGSGGSGGGGGGGSGGDGGQKPWLRGTTDLTPLRFTFPRPSLTNSDFTTKQRRIDNGGAANIAGAISFMYTMNNLHYYQIAYDAADRPSAAGTATYLISDGITPVLIDLQVIAIASTGGGGGTTFDQAPVTPTGRLRQIIIGDDYLEANGRSFVWTVPAVTGFVAASVTAKFGASAVFACGAYSFLVSATGVTDNGDGTWEVSIDLPGSATLSLEPGDYDWSMTLSHNDVNITKIQNLTPTERVKIFASPS